VTFRSSPRSSLTGVHRAHQQPEYFASRHPPPLERVGLYFGVFVVCIYLQTLPSLSHSPQNNNRAKPKAKEPRLQVSQGLSQTPAAGLWAYIEKAASIMLGVKKEDDGPLLQDSNGGGGLEAGGGSSKTRVDAKGLKSKKTHVKHQGEDEDTASSSSSTSSSSSSAVTAAVAAAANSSTATAAGSSSSSPAGGADERKKCGKRGISHALPHWVGTSFNECSKRARRPPPRFTESGLDSKEESILRQAIENSKIETHLCDTVEIAEVPTFR